MKADAQASSTAAAVNAAQQGGKTPRPRILVVDDDGDIRNLNVMALTSSGYQVDEAENGEVAWDSIHLNTYDLIVTDNNMPKLSGLDLLKQMRASRITLPVIMATGKVPTEEFSRSPWLKPCAMLVKPYSISDLLGMVKNVLSQCGGEVQSWN